MSLDEKMKAAGFKYGGEATCYCRFVRFGEVNGIHGRWILHEFGGAEMFQPSTTDSGRYNNSC